MNLIQVIQARIQLWTFVFELMNTRIRLHERINLRYINHI